MEEFRMEFNKEMMELARKILSMDRICDSCLGRQFARVSHGLTNEERGKLIREIIGAEPSSGCWMCGGIMHRLEEYARQAVEKMRSFEFRTFAVGTKLSGLLIENEEELWSKFGSRWSEPMKREINREVGKIVERITGKNADLKSPDLLVLIDLERESVEIKPLPIFIFGRYRKMVRGIPQTRWPCRACRGRGCGRCGYTGKMYAESVEELIGHHIKDAFDAEDAVLHGGGREDIDARMLGNGRPFVVEVRSPRRRMIELEELQRRINEHSDGKVEVIGLKFCDRRMIRRVKEERMDKVYHLKIIPDRRVSRSEMEDALKKIVGKIEQRTPTRVLHRRGDLLRVREVKDARVISSNQCYEVEICCEGGLYVKELITGDGGRTRPSLSGVLGCGVRVEELDVVQIRDNFNTCHSERIEDVREKEE